MGNMIDPKPWHAATEESRGPVQCRAAVPVAYKFSLTVPTVYIPGYSKIHWQRSGQVKAAAAGCPSTPCSGSRRKAAAPPADAISADGTRRNAEARVKAKTEAVV